MAGGTAVEARLQLRPVPVSAGLARRFVTATLEAWDRAALVDTCVLLVSELVTNAVLHARSDVDLVLTQSGGSVRVEVRDASPAAPVVKAYELGSMTGRGLALVDSFSQRWGVDTAGAGKSVWFELDDLVVGQAV